MSLPPMPATMLRWSPRSAARRDRASIARDWRSRRSRRRRDRDRRIRGRRRGRARSPPRRARAGVPVNVIDKPAFCDFSFGAIVNRSPLVIGISTDGAAPVFGAGDPRQARGADPARLRALGRRRAALARRACRRSGLSFARRRRFWQLFTARALREPDREPAPARLSTRCWRRRAEGATRRARLGHAGRRRAGRSGTADAARRARAAIRRRHPDRRSGRRPRSSISRAARRRRCWSARPATAPSCKQDEINALMVSLAQGRQARGAAQGRRSDDLRPRRRGDRGLPQPPASRSRSCPASRRRRARPRRLGVSLTHRDAGAAAAIRHRPWRRRQAAGRHRLAQPRRPGAPPRWSTCRSGRSPSLRASARSRRGSTRRRRPSRSRARRGRTRGHRRRRSRPSPRGSKRRRRSGPVLVMIGRALAQAVSARDSGDDTVRASRAGVRFARLKQLCLLPRRIGKRALNSA